MKLSNPQNVVAQDKSRFKYWERTSFKFNDISQTVSVVA